MGEEEEEEEEDTIRNFLPALSITNPPPHSHQPHHIISIRHPSAAAPLALVLRPPHRPTSHTHPPKSGKS